MKNLTLKKEDYKRRFLLVCHAGADVGIGHLKRLLTLEPELRQHNGSSCVLLVFGGADGSLSEYAPHAVFVDSRADFSRTLMTYVKNFRPHVVTFDLKTELVCNIIHEVLEVLKTKKIAVVSVDGLRQHRKNLDLLWIPSFYSPELLLPATKDSLVYWGWGSYLIRRKFSKPPWRPGNRLLVLLGGTDIAGVGESLPFRLDRDVDDSLEVDWVQGPFASAPRIPETSRHLWRVHKAPNSLDALISQSNYVVSAFGVSFFECLLYGKPTVVFSPYGAKDDEELDELKKENVAMVAKQDSLTSDLTYLIRSDSAARQLAKRASRKISSDGPKTLSRMLYRLAKR